MTRENLANYEDIVNGVIEEHKTSPVDIFGIGDAEGELLYLNQHKGSYVRTIREIDTLWKGSDRSRTILEIGSFLGPVSISLKKLGYRVYAVDIPEFYESSSLQSLYQRNGIPFTGLNLRRHRSPMTLIFLM